MLLHIQKQIRESLGKQVEVCMKNSERLVGTITWVSPDDTMAELKMADGQIKLLTDVVIKTIKRS
ncbi:hypothetical protein G3578_15395 [Brevibacillus sp. SYP-B805]|uniref:hypothetical protein n=1 Tax=Brevibacillus sp. SYP-B805 TaxID=1578199 RepID=UPI0013EA868E|nr:hypothetical protein [Brevibacillus sp. SYP-B805]NGQ96546.1 hypothetical protein [Brevibacillus sp. SYP-B805]